MLSQMVSQTLRMKYVGRLVGQVGEVVRARVGERGADRADRAAQSGGRLHQGHGAPTGRT